MKFTHTRDNGLAALLVGMHGECRVFLSQFGKTVVEFGNISLTLRLHSDRNHCVGECDALQHDGMSLVAECVTRADILETNTGADVTSINAIHGLLLVGVHLEQTAHALFLARASVEHIRTALHLT